ncbi:MAG: MopE-related protein [Myxococcota bacterium]
MTNQSKPIIEGIASGLFALLVGACAAAPEQSDCRTDQQCPLDHGCSEGQCIPAWAPCEVDTDCGQGESCVGDRCLLPGRCFTDDDCGDAQHCETGVCQAVACAPESCGEGQWCDEERGTCTPVACRADSDCAFPLVCDTQSRDCVEEGSIPSPERCDAIDNDLDGDVDEGYALGELCTEGIGPCMRQGTLVCSDDGDVECDVEAATPEPERCDGIDNDCDGTIDEDFTQLDAACEAGLGACALGTWVCGEEGDVVCQPLPLSVPSVELCDGIDNDCDGEVDEDFFPDGESCTHGLGACAVLGWLTCSPDLLDVECVPSIASPTAIDERCDGLDNDCDGQIDEGVC